MNEVIRQEDMVLLPPDDSDEIFLAEKAGAIRALGKRVVGDIIEIGRHLTEAKERVGHGGWEPWIDREFAWKEVTAWNYMNVFERMANLQGVEDLIIDAKSLYAIAGPNTPAEVRKEIVQRAAKGEKLTNNDVKRLIDDAKVKITKEAKAALVEAEKAHKREIAAIEKKVATAEAKAEKLAEANTRYKADVAIIEKQMKDADIKAKADRAEYAKGLEKMRADAREEARVKEAGKQAVELARMMDDLKRELTHYEPPLKWPTKGKKTLFWESVISLNALLTKLIGGKDDVEQS